MACPFSRRPALTHPETLSKDALDQLTYLLYMPQDVDLHSPNEKWLKEQKYGVQKLAETLRQPICLLSCLCKRINHLRNPSEFARLCHAHEGLNSRVIRYFMMPLIDEYTRRTRRFRKWRKRIDFPSEFNAWVDRLDAVTALWIDPKAFRTLFGYDNATPATVTVKSRCEACIMAAIGGRPQTLVDLRAILVARQRTEAKDCTKGSSVYRLLDSWMSHFHPDDTALVNESCGIAEKIMHVNQEIRSEKRRRKKERHSKGKGANNKHRSRRRRHKSAARLGERSDLPRQTLDGLRPELNEQSHDYEAHYEADEEQWGCIPIAHGENAAYFGDDAEEDTRTWLDRKMNGLTETERQELFSSVHEALLRSQPATPAAKASHGEQTPSLNTIWEAASVHSKDQSQESADEFASRSRPPRVHRQAPTPRSDTEAAGSRGHSDVSYVPARKNWHTQDLYYMKSPEANQAPVSPSSFYSSHPGFRRSQCDYPITTSKKPPSIRQWEHQRQDAGRFGDFANSEALSALEGRPRRKYELFE